MNKKTFFTYWAVAIFCLLSIPAAAQNLSDIFSSHQKLSKISVDHNAWDKLLNRYLDAKHPSGVNRFNYAQVNAADSAALDTYLSMLAAVSIHTLNQNEQMAYWINFYNALTVRVILDHYPLTSIRDISLPGSRGGPWKAKLVDVAGHALSLDDMEHRILRPIWKDKRIHYALNCASIGCPDLANRAYSAENLEDMLEIAATNYINHPRAVSTKGRRLILSSIYKWYKEDFGNLQQLYDHFLTYAQDELANNIRNASGSPRYDYDWKLNAP